MKLVTDYARDVLHRSETNSDQALVAIDVLAGTHSADPCADSNLAIMRRYDLSSSYLQAIGYVVNGYLVCSSQGRDGTDLPLGPVDWVTPIGVRIRINVRFPFDPVTSYLVLEGHDGFAAIINKDLPLDATTNEPDASLGAFATINGHLMARHGFIDPKWMGPTATSLPKRQQVSTFVDHGYVVAVVRSSRYNVGTVAALPVSYMLAQTQATTRVLLPVGVVAGIVLAIAAVYLGRLQMAMPAVIRTALKRREFFVHYQPIIDLRTGAWGGRGGAGPLATPRRRDGATGPVHSGRRGRRHDSTHYSVRSTTGGRGR